LDDELKPVSAGSIGELWVGGGTVMQGYWGRAERTSRTPGIVEFKSNLQRTSSGKIDRQALIGEFEQSADKSIREETWQRA
jgi:acyl-CoA synthetase (AMP-forming)/AMP-acid ligase II